MDKIQLKQVIVTIAFVFLFCCLTQILFDPFAPYANRQELNALQIELNAAKAKWDSKNIKDYSYEEWNSVQMQGSCSAKIKVKEGKIVEVLETMHHGLEKLPHPIPLAPSQWDSDYCYYSRFTVLKVFDMVQESIDEEIKVGATFNPQFGFVTEFHSDANVQGGLLTCCITESYSSYTFSNFRRLRSSTP